MRLWTELVGPRGWPPLRRVLFAVLALVVALAGATPVPVAAQQGVVEVQFSMQTLPIDIEGEKPVLCQGQTYKIFARGVVTRDRSGVPRLADEIVTATSTLNPITPDRYRRLAHNPMVIFYYNAKERGEDAVEFGSTEVFTSGGTRGIGSKILSLIVRECTYKVTLIYHWQDADASGSTVQFGIVAETRLERNEDGTYAGNGFYTVSTLVSVPGCTANISDFEAPIGLTGKLLQDSRELELTVNYGKGTSKFVATCQDVPGSGGASAEVDSAPPGVPQKPKFPQEGGGKSFPVKHPFGAGTVTILVEKEVVNIAR